MLDPQVMSAFNRVSHTAISVVGDDCKDDLILLGQKLGMTEEVLRKERPDLYERGTDNISMDDIAEGDTSEVVSSEYDPTFEEEKTEDE